MTESVQVATHLTLKECGFDEFWLQDQIFKNPSILHLGELEVVSLERRQSSGGKLDLLLKDPEDNSMYEVEVMLGATDESHIIRAIEYWDLEKRKWPQRQHYCVIVAEIINRRFFNVIQLLSNSIPIIAIQANIIQAGTQRLLNLTKILDLYEEPEDTEGLQTGIYDEAYWKKRAPWTVEAAYAFLSVAKELFPDAALGFVMNY